MLIRSWSGVLFFFFFNDTATTEIYTLSLHDALPISGRLHEYLARNSRTTFSTGSPMTRPVSISAADRKSTRLNSSHLVISYAVFCLKKKNLGSTPSTAVVSFCASFKYVTAALYFAVI